MTKVMHYLKKYTIVPIIVLMFIIFSIFGDSFLQLSNFENILMQSSIFGTMAIGMTFLIVCGYFDLSAGVVMGLAANLTISLQIAGLGIGFSVIIVLLISIAIGTLNGFLVTKAKINAFIVTLAMMLSIRGFTYFICDGDQLRGPISEFANYANGNIGGVSYLTITFIILLIISAIVMRFFLHGRNTYAVGGNPDAAYNAGIKVDRVKVINFLLCSFAAGIGGVMTASRMNAATPYLGYPDGSITIITCVVLGGTSLTGGVGGMVFTLGGTFAYFMFRNGLNMMNVPSAFNYIATGLILIAIVTFDKLVANRGKS